MKIIKKRKTHMHPITIAERKTKGAGTAMLLALLEESRWSLTRAGELSGTSKWTVLRLVKRLGLSELWEQRKGAWAESGDALGEVVALAATATGEGLELARGVLVGNQRSAADS